MDPELFLMAKIDSSLGLRLLAELSTADLNEILSDAKAVRVARNPAVFEEAHSFFVLLHGQVRGQQDDAGGRIDRGALRLDGEDF